MRQSRAVTPAVAARSRRELPRLETSRSWGSWAWPLGPWSSSPTPAPASPGPPTSGRPRPQVTSKHLWWRPGRAALNLSAPDVHARGGSPAPEVHFDTQSAYGLIVLVARVRNLLGLAARQSLRSRGATGLEGKQLRQR